MIRNGLTYVATFKLAVIIVATLCLSSVSALAEPKNDDAVILIGAFGKLIGPSDDGLEASGIFIYLWRHGDTLLGGVDVVASSTSDEAMIFNGHYHAATSTLDFRVEFPRLPGETTIQDDNMESRPFPKSLMAMEYHLAIRNHRLVGTEKTIYDDEKDQNPDGTTRDINIPMVTPSLVDWAANYLRNFDNQSEWFDFAWCELSSVNYKVFFYNMRDQGIMCDKYWKYPLPMPGN